MNQSDIRGLSHSIGTEPTLIFSVGSVLLSKCRESSPPKTNLSHSPARILLLSCLHLLVSYLTIQFSKIRLRRLGDKKYQAAFF